MCTGWYFRFGGSLSTWENLLVALTVPPTANNLKFLDGKKDEMDLGANDGSEAGVDARLPPDR